MATSTIGLQWRSSYFFSFSLGYFYSVGYFYMKEYIATLPMSRIS
jgi:hypothetical protein